MLPAYADHLVYCGDTTLHVWTACLTKLVSQLAGASTVRSVFNLSMMWYAGFAALEVAHNEGSGPIERVVCFCTGVLHPVSTAVTFCIGALLNKRR